MVANWLTMDCGGQFYMAAAGWCGTSSGMTALCEVGCFSAFSWVVVARCSGFVWHLVARCSGFVWHRVELHNRVDVPIQLVVV